ncbi:choice-of-anchor C family protein [Actinoallomurus purpureus]|uniref:choice-of-anchor C family protein n=1 Tax=Actinoallomurus purpureus TaxID=478114 RepID=UPI0020926B7E|nr:choice-of-anchor C family protein [Actinoallomurus purpureus]MCO6008251.1 choice-of-anchor C family protein [Actinoallomurus purpureus]
MAIDATPAGRFASDAPRLRGCRPTHARPWRRLCAGAGLAAALAGSAAFAAAPANATSGLADGSFETPVVTPGTFQTFSSGQLIGPWRVTNGSVDLIGGGFWQASDGRQSLDLSGGSAGGVTQTFATRPGVIYEVIYALAGNPQGSPAVKTGQVFINGALAQNFSFDVTGHTVANMGYVTRAVRFRATGVSSTVHFSSTTNSAYGPVIDDVGVDRCGCGV